MMGAFRLSVLACALALVCGCASDPEVVPDRNTDGLEPSCVKADCSCASQNDCRAHSECVNGDVASKCECVTGYEQYGEFCVFVGLADPDLDGDPADVWAFDDGVVLDPAVSEDDMHDDGAVAWEPEAQDARAGFRQSLAMPTIEQSEPFVAVISSMVSGQGGQTAGWFANGVFLGLGRHYERFPVDVMNTWRSQRQCLGEDAYGTDLEVAVRAGPLAWIFPDMRLRVDSVQIEPAGQDECPALGEVMNGDFETPMGWTGEAGILGKAEIRPEIGLAGTSAGYLEMNDCYCYQAAAELRSQVSIPSAEHGGKAIRFAWRASPGTAADVSLGRAEFGGIMRLIMGTTGRVVSGVGGDQQTLQYDMACVPPDAYGSVTSINFAIRCDYRSELCAGTRFFVVDEVELVDAVGCPTSGAGSDLSFELTENAVLPGWGTTVDVGRSASIARIDAEAFDGNQVLRFQTSAENAQCDPVEAHSSFVYPSIGAGQRPAIRLHYRFSDTVDPTAELIPLRVRDRLLAGVRFKPVDAMGARLVGWQEATICDDVGTAGTPVEFSLQFDPGTQTDCSMVPDVQYVDVDGIEVLAVPEAECP